MNNNYNNFIIYKFYDLLQAIICEYIVPTTLQNIFRNIINNIPFNIIPNEI